MRMRKNLFNKVWDLHVVDELESGLSQVYIGLHLIHEVTSPQAFQSLKEKNIGVFSPERTFATVDHIVPTIEVQRPFKDVLAEEMIEELVKNTKEYGIKYFGLDSDSQGVVHVIGPELGLTQPGMTIACGDSHTSTHGAFGSLAFGIGTSQVTDVLATQTLSMKKLKVRKINVSGKLQNGVYAKDVILYIINKLGVNGGIGFAYEYSGSTIDSLSMEERMTVCNMSIEGGARTGYINPDQTTYEYLKGKEYAPDNFEDAIEYWNSIRSDSDAEYDDVVEIYAEDITPMVTWGINPGQSVSIENNLPSTDNMDDESAKSIDEAMQYMEFSSEDSMKGKNIDVVFIGSCTNGRLSDLHEAARVIKGKKVSENVRALVVPGSKEVYNQAVTEGLDKVFIEAGFEWREPGCSMCLAMNPDKLEGNEICASTSNRNFKGRQGSPKGRTLLMSPAMAAAAAIRGEVVDVREF